MKLHLRRRADAGSEKGRGLPIVATPDPLAEQGAPTPRPSIGAGPLLHLLQAAAGRDDLHWAVPGLLHVVEAAGFQAEAAWLLAPHPADPPGSLSFRLDRNGRRGRPRKAASLRALLSDLAYRPGQLELWAISPSKLARLALAVDDDGLGGYQPATADRYAGPPEKITEATDAWAVALTSREAPAAPNPTPARSLDRELLTEALQGALSQVRVEVDLGAIDAVVSDSLRAAIAEVTPQTLARPSSAESTRAQVPALGHRRRTGLVRRRGADGPKALEGPA